MANLNKVKKYHFIYKTTNLLNDKYYVGMHSTNNLKDGYLGSGKRLRYSIRKYGVENFKLEILEWFDTREALVERETQLVNEDLLKDEMCLNLKLGGNGGFVNDEHAKKFHSSGGRAVLQMFGKLHQYKMETDLEYREKVCIKLRGRNTFGGKSHSEESKNKMRESSKGNGAGSSNSQFGTCWITNGNENKKLYKSDLIPEGWKLGRKYL